MGRARAPTRFDREAALAGRASQSSRSTPRRPRRAARCTSATSSATPTPTAWPATSGWPGFEVFYPIGWDDNGLPTERRVQNYYGVRGDATPALRRGLRAARQQGGDGKSIKAADQQPISRGRTSSSCATILTVKDEEAFESLFRRLGLQPRLGHHLPHHRRPLARRRRSRRSCATSRRGEAYQAEAPGLWDVTFQTAVAQAELEARDYPGAYHRVAFHGPTGGDPVSHRDHPPRAASRACVALIAHPDDERYAGAVRHHGHLAAVRRRGAGARPPGRRDRQGRRHRDVLHLRRPHRRACGGASCSCRPARSSPATAGSRRETPEWIAGEPGRGAVRRASPARRRSARASRGRRRAARVRRPRRRADGRPSARRTSTRRATSRSRSSPRASGTSATAAATPTLRAAAHRSAASEIDFHPGVHAHAATRTGSAASTATG